MKHDNLKPKWTASTSQGLLLFVVGILLVEDANPFFGGSHHPALIQGAMSSGDRWERFSAVAGGDEQSQRFFPTRSDS